MKTSSIFRTLSLLTIGLIYYSCQNEDVSSKSNIQEERQSTVRSNLLNFTLSKDITNFKFTPEKGAYAITSGQPWEGTLQTSEINYHYSIIVLAGRKKSHSVGKWYAKQIGHGQAACTIQGQKSLPSELHFAFRGSISFTYKGENYEVPYTTIAQGEHSYRNNWWIGGPNYFRNSNKHTHTTYILQTEIQPQNGKKTQPAKLLSFTFYKSNVFRVSIID